MSFITDLATHVKTWANTKFQTKLPDPAGNSGKVVSSDGTNYVLSTVSGGAESFSLGLTSLSIALTAGYYSVEISANSTFVLSGIATGKYYTFCVKNTSASTITVSVPSGSVCTSLTTDITTGKAKEFSLIFDGTKQRWQISDELINA